MEWLTISIGPVLLFIGGVLGKWLEKQTAQRTSETQSNVEFAKLLMERVNRLSDKTDKLRTEMDEQRHEIITLKMAIANTETVLEVWKQYAVRLYQALRDSGRSAPIPPEIIRDDWHDLI